MKVLMVTPYPPKADGIGEHTRALVGALDGLGDVEVDVLTSARPAAASSDDDRVHRVLSSDPRAVGAAFEVIRRIRPDVIHYQFAVPAFGSAGLGAIRAGARARRELGIPLVFTFHEVRREIDLLRAPGRLLYRRLVALADAVVVHTTEARELVVSECGADPSAVWITPLGAEPPAAALVEPAVIEAVTDRYGVADRPYVLCFGYLHPDKGIEHLVEAATRLRAQPAGVEADVLIAGVVRPRSGLFRLFGRVDRAYEATLRTAVAAGGVGDRVRFVGFVPSDDAPALIAAARAVVMPCTKVTQSSVLSNVVVAGTPAIASDLPGLRETLGDGGILVPVGDVDALASAIERVMTDIGLADDLRERVRRRSGAHRLANVAVELQRVYRHAMRQQASPDPQEVMVGGN